MTIPRYVVHLGTNSIMHADECMVVNSNLPYDVLDDMLVSGIDTNGYAVSFFTVPDDVCKHCGMFTDTNEYADLHFTCDICHVDRPVDELRVWHRSNRHMPTETFSQQVCLKCDSHMYDQSTKGIQNDRW
jgi:hypothetical protein